MIADPNLVNPIEELTQRLSNVGYAVWMLVFVIAVVGFWFVWIHRKGGK